MVSITDQRLSLAAPVERRTDRWTIPAVHELSSNYDYVHGSNNAHRGRRPRYSLPLWTLDCGRNIVPFLWHCTLQRGKREADQAFDANHQLDSVLQWSTAQSRDGNDIWLERSFSMWEVRNSFPSLTYFLLRAHTDRSTHVPYTKWRNIFSR